MLTLRARLKLSADLVAARKPGLLVGKPVEHEGALLGDHVALVGRHEDRLGGVLVVLAGDADVDGAGELLPAVVFARRRFEAGLGREPRDPGCVVGHIGAGDGVAGVIHHGQDDRCLDHRGAGGRGGEELELDLLGDGVAAVVGDVDFGGGAVVPDPSCDDFEGTALLGAALPASVATGHAGLGRHVGIGEAPLSPGTGAGLENVAFVVGEGQQDAGDDLLGALDGLEGDVDALGEDVALAVLDLGARRLGLEAGAETSTSKAPDSSQPQIQASEMSSQSLNSPPSTE